MKEKDLELAAKIGQSLLEQNRELQDRNDFLEESLNASNEAIVQLRHELQMRINLLHVYADYEDDLDSPISREKLSMVESLQQRVKKLEEENTNLKLEAANLKKYSSSLEKEERLKMKECCKNLDIANEKIASLQSSIMERNEECAMQNIEIERLLRNVSSRKIREKTLLNENADLHELLNNVLAKHEALSKEVVELHDRYAEVMSMLHDAEEELGTFRQNKLSYRASSTDSLYDSLASELEASDSGFYSTINSARSDNQCVIRSQNGDRFQRKLERISVAKFDRKRSIEKSNTKMRSVAVATDQHLMNPLVLRKRSSFHSGEDVVDIPTSILAEIVQHTENVDMHHINQPQKIFCGESGEISSSISHQVCKNFELKTSISAQHCEDGQCAKTKALNANNGEGIYRTSSWPYRYWNRKSCGKCQNGAISKASSSDSLASYEGPKMGEPGRPGTRDLDYSLRRLNIRRQWNTSDYATILLSQKSTEILKHVFESSYCGVFRLSKSASMSNIGIWAAVHSDCTIGVVTRSCVNSNSTTPVITPKHNKVQHQKWCSNGVRAISSFSLSDRKMQTSKSEMKNEVKQESAGSLSFHVSSHDCGIITRSNLS